MQQADKERDNKYYHGLSDEVYADVLSALSDAPDNLDALLDPLHESDVATLIERLKPQLREELLKHIQPERLGTILTEVSSGVQDSLLQNVSKEDLVGALETLESDDVADIILHLGEDQVEDAQDVLEDLQRGLLLYPEDSAGGLMQLEVVALPGDWTVADVLDHIREHKDDMPSNLDTIFIVGYKKKLLGSVTLSELVRQDVKLKLNEIMNSDSVSVTPILEQHEVARIFQKYDILNCAVVDESGALLGVITIDDIVDVIVEEHEWELMASSGLKSGEDLFAPVFKTSKTRFPWLFINLLTAVVASFVIALFEDQIARLVVLAVLMPIIASMGGNAGMQSLTVAVRGLALKQLTLKNATQLLWKELKVGGFNGLLLAIILGLGVLIVYGDFPLAAVIWVATVANHFLAALSGILIPVFLEKHGKDPAISGSILLTTVTDVGGFFIFLSLATIFLL